MNTIERALESWDFILYDDKKFGYLRIFYGTQKIDIVPNIMAQEAFRYFLDPKNDENSPYNKMC